MRVLFVLTYLYDRGGDSRHAFSLAEGLEARGHAVRFFGMEDPANRPGMPGPLAPHVDYRRLLADGGGGALRAVRSVWSPAAGRAAEDFLRRHGPFDVAHVHSVHHQLTASVLAALERAGIPCVWTLHDYKLVCPNTSLFVDGRGIPCPAPGRGSPVCVALRRCKKGSLAASALTAVESSVLRLGGFYDRIACYISPTRFLRDLLEAGGITSRPVEVLPNFSPVPAETRPSAPGGDVLFAGRLTAPKGAEVLIRAFAASREALGGRLVLAGDGEERTTLERLASGLLPGDAFRFTGAVQGSGAMRDLYLASGFLALPSLWIENMPLSILEAFSCARPAVASRVGGVPELVEEGITGRLVPPGSVEALADALVSMASDREALARMGEDAWRTARERHSLEGYVRRVEAVYRRAAEGGCS